MTKPSYQSSLPSHATLQEAAEWFVVINDHQAADKDKEAWKTWLDQHPSHSQAWQYVEKVHQRFNSAQSLAGKQPLSRSLKAAQHDRISRRKLLQSTSALGLLALIGWQHDTIQRHSRHYIAEHRAITGEILHHTLDDGGTLWINSSSSVNVNYSNSARSIELLRGEIYIETSKDPYQRPFTVTTAQGQLKALGTAFTVEEQADSTLIAVFEGAVEVKTAQGQHRVILAGQQAWFSSRHISPITIADNARKAWPFGVILANDIPLADLVNQIRRYYSGYISVDPEVAELSIMGTFPAKKPEHALSMLESALPVKVNSPFPGWITIRKK